MARIRQVSLIAAIAYSFCADGDAQESKLFDKSRFFGVTSSALTPDQKETTRPKATFSLTSSGSLVPDTSSDIKPEIRNYNGLYVSAFSGAKSLDITPETEPNRITSASPAGTPPDLAKECGPSPVSVADIKALIVQNAGTYGVDADFALAIAWTESRFDQIRNSPKGARGPMQLMPGTAKRFRVNDVCDPADNIGGGIRYLRVLLDEFESPLIAAAAYNAGEQAVYDFGGVPPYPETVRYVASVINHQLGIAIPQKQSSSGKNQTIDIGSGHTDAVIGALAPKFVGGVMQF